MQRPFALALQQNKTNLKKTCPDQEEHVDSNKEGKALHLKRAAGPSTVWQEEPVGCIWILAPEGCLSGVTEQECDMRIHYQCILSWDTGYNSLSTE